MKILSILLAAFLFNSLVANAQTEKGIQNFGFDLGLGYTHTNYFNINPYDHSTLSGNTKNTNFNIGPNYSYFIADKLDVGVNLSYSTSVTTNNTANQATNNSYPLRQSSDNYGGGLFIRKYFMYKSKIGLRAGGYIAYSRGDQKNTYSVPYSVYDYNSFTNYYNIGTNVDLVYYPSKNLGFSARIANLGYEHYKADNTSQGNGSGDYVNLNFINDALSLSVFYVFGAK